jgi:hypothetical protein
VRPSTSRIIRVIYTKTQRPPRGRSSVDGLREPQRRIRKRSKAKLTDREVRAAIAHGRQTFVADASVAIAWVHDATLEVIAGGATVEVPAI